jgi:hypothetical protein
MLLNAALILLTALGFNSVRYESNSKRTKVFILTDGDRVEALQKIHKAIPGSSITAKSYHSSQGHVEAPGLVFVTKPINSGATENLRINTARMSKLGDLRVVNLFGKNDVECREFLTSNSIIHSFLDEFETNPNVSFDIWNTWHQYLLAGNNIHFKWNPATSISEKNELGKYLGEMLLGVFALNNLIPFVKDPSSVVFPTSSSFSGVDVAIYSNFESVPISHKFGVGAKASFFTNLLPKILVNRSQVKKSWALYDFLKSVDSVDRDVSRSKEMVYNYGVRTVLGIGQETILDPFDIYRLLINGLPGSNYVRMVVSQIKRQCTLKSILDRLTPACNYSSITGFFTREIAARLNSCDKSSQFMTSLLADQNFYQANLNTKKWLGGEIEYSWLHSSDAVLNILGSKCSLTDLSDSGLLAFGMKSQTN